MKVLMVCSGGFSSTIIVNAIKKEADKQGLDIEITACGTPDFAEVIEQFNPKVAIVAPQVKHRFAHFKEEADKHNIPVEQIPLNAYTPLGAPKIINELIKKYMD
ncbi:PTS sugar transporter subunit IIB [Clostridium uliginosum]|uniref:PTS system, cellobiose-specific IIB component n=1 Tax=Clostridium uliginosum TaxID=119641 RepID=A0A1I1MZU3_9CLOT|nr:PTS sugar transporter subunit IIB [Clostridium uliginosum]SFC90695.1 PTS system, cellobiose-specific IIB component [Clostridium uliginosum]